MRLPLIALVLVFACAPVASAEALHRLLHEMHAEHGLTSVIATHNPRLAAACDRVLRLEQGKLHAA